MSDEINLNKKIVLNCAICLEDISDDTIQFTLCAHPFHICCITMWFKQNTSLILCPICKFDITSMRKNHLVEDTILNISIITTNTTTNTNTDTNTITLMNRDLAASREPFDFGFPRIFSNGISSMSGANVNDNINYNVTSELNTSIRLIDEEFATYLTLSMYRSAIHDNLGTDLADVNFRLEQDAVAQIESSDVLNYHLAILLEPDE